MRCQYCGKGDIVEKHSGKVIYYKCTFCGNSDWPKSQILKRIELRRQLIVAGFGGWWANASEVDSGNIISTADALLVELLGPEPGEGEDGHE